MSQKIAAQKIGVKQNTWSNYENGKSYPDPETIEDIIKILDIERDQLFKNPEVIDASDLNLNKMYNKSEHSNILEYIDVLENSGELNVIASNRLKSYILGMFKDLNDLRASLVKQHEKYDDLRDIATPKS